MIRRHFMALLGFAPAAAAMVPSAVVKEAVRGNVGPIPSPSHGLDCFVTAASQVDSRVEHARRALEAVKWARKNNLPDAHGAPPDCSASVDDIQAMRSWSHVTKGRLTRERIAAAAADGQLRYVQTRLERELKLALAPEWMRRFL